MQTYWVGGGIAPRLQWWSVSRTVRFTPREWISLSNG